MELAEQLWKSHHTLHKIKAQQHMKNAMHGESYILQYVAKHDGCVIPSEISHEMNISSARIAILLNSLEEKGLLVREIDRNDRRKTILKLTVKGQQQAEKMRHRLLQLLAKMLESLGEKDAKEYIRIVSRLAELSWHEDL